MSETRHAGPVRATLAGITDRLRGGGARLTLADDERLDGRTALVTGANRGLGTGIALRLARRGARLLLPSRSDPSDIVAACRDADAGVTPLDLDLADVASIDRLADTLRDEPLDVVVLNAGVVPLGSRQTDAGIDIQVAVNYLGNVALLERLLADGTLPSAEPWPDRPARVVFVSSESHREAADLDPGALAAPVEYGLGGVLPQYGVSKLLLTRYAFELARALPPEAVGVFTLCPGAVASGIAREAPWWLRPWVNAAMKVGFQSPLAAAVPIEWLCCARELDGTTGRYWHMHQEKDPDPRVHDAAAGAALREHSVALVQEQR